MTARTITLDGKEYVVLPRVEYDGLSKAAQLPPLPEPDAEGHYPAVEYARVSLARDMILHCTRLGLTQAELARRAGIREETLCRIERGKHSPSVATMQKLDRVLNAKN